MDELFRTALKRYLEVVYPKADLKDSSFVQDLLNRILVSYYLNPDREMISDDCVPFYRKPKTFEEISKELNKLVGLSKVKKQFKNIYMLTQDKKSLNRQRFHFTFVGNPGTGKTTVAKLTAEMLFSMGVIKKNRLVAISSTDVISVYKGESAQLMKEKINEAKGGVLFIDEAYFLTSKTSETSTPQKQVLEVLLTEMENHSDELTVIFAGYTNEIDDMLKSNPGLASRVPYTFEFEDYSTEELMQIFRELAHNEDMDIALEAEEALYERIEIARTEENFGNARTIANIYQQLKVIWLEQEKEERVFSENDIRKSMPVPLHSNFLNEMIGLESIKKELSSFESRIRYIKYLKDMNMSIPTPNMHMMFIGNPGTGKTTVAKKIADCLYQIGLLKTNKVTVAERKDLIDNYVGGTEKKTNALIQKAMNGVLFIDEAYSLYKPDDPKDYGIEAITALITAMENFKDSLIIIYAGYGKEMSIFLKANSGISSRIGFTFHFPDYTPDELVMIYYMKMRKNGFRIEEDALEEVLKVMKYFSESENFGNGRFVDRVIDITINKRAKRSYAKKYNDISVSDIPEINELIRISTDQQHLWTDEEQSEDMRQRIAVHEVGHALVSIFCEPSRRVDYISINADAGSQGKIVTEYGSDHTTEGALKADLAVKFGGRNAERLIYGEHSAGCLSDFSSAKKLASYMINDLAIGELGVTTPMDLLQEADQKASEILKQHRDDLEKIASRLVTAGKISGAELERLLL